MCAYMDDIFSCTGVLHAVLDMFWIVFSFLSGNMKNCLATLQTEGNNANLLQGSNNLYEPSLFLTKGWGCTLGVVVAEIKNKSQLFSYAYLFEESRLWRVKTMLWDH